MVGYTEMFEKRKMSYYWDTDRLGGGSNNGYGEGILRFCTGDTNYTEARDILVKVKNRLDKKKK